MLSGMTSLVTGAASGIGRATAMALHEQGASVALVDIDGRVTNVASALGARALDIVHDLADLGSLDGIVRLTLERFGRIDHLVNCAGITGGPMTLFDVDIDAWRRVYAVNLEAPLVLTKHVAGHMVERGEGGRIVNVSSSSAFRARMSQLAYGSSKAALVQLTRSLAAELGEYGITVNAVAPGLTRSAITEPMGEETMGALVSGEGPLGNLLKRVSEPEDVAGAIVFLCSPAARQITAQTLHTSAGAVI